MTSYMEKYFLFRCLLLLATFSIVQSQFSTGATANECESLQPSGVTPAEGGPPFRIGYTTQTYEPNGTPITVFIASTDVTGVDVQGLVIQARRANNVDTSPVGSFTLSVIGGDFRFLTCGSSTTGTLTNIDDTPQTLPFIFSWNPPADNVGDVTFLVSLVESDGSFWSNISPDNPLPPNVPPPSLNIANCPIPTVQGSQASWTPPNCLRGGAVLGNSAICTPPSGSTFSPGDTSVTCECQDQGETASCSFIVTIAVPTDPCNPSPCENGGTCIAVPTIPSGFFCQCPTGLPQPTCTAVPTDPCNPSPCENGGTCIAVSAIPSGFFCQCPTGLPQPTCTAGNPPSAPNCPLSGVVETAPAGSVGVQVNYNTVVCNDPEDGTITATCDSPSNTFFPLGTTTVTCTCTDSATQTSSCTFDVIVNQIGAACANNPCLGNECRESANSLAGYTCHSVTGTPCIL